MKKNVRILAILIPALFFFFSPDLARAQTILAPGDLFFTGYNSNPASGEDNFSFVLLKAVSAGTFIKFTDRGWYIDPGPVEGFLTTTAVQDGVIQWTATAAVACGTEIYIVCEGNLALSASVGSVTGLVTASGAVITPPNTSTFIELNSAGDQLFAYQGADASPTLLAGLDMNGGFIATLSTSPSSTQSALPSSLGSFNAIALTPENDNATYNCPAATTTGGPAAVYAALTTPANWVLQNATYYTLPTGCTWTIAGCGSPEINVTGNGTNIVDGDASPATIDSTNFGNAIVGSNETRSFTIQNTGTSNLSVSSITSSNALFTVSALSPVSPVAGGGSATFTISFSPTTSGIQTTTITINNDDADEGVYTFDVQSTGTYQYKYNGSGSWLVTANWDPEYPGLTIPVGYNVYGNPGQSIVIPGGTTITVNGTIFHDGSMTVGGNLNNNNSVRSVTISNHGIITNAPGSTLIADFGLLENFSTGQILNSGTLKATNAAVFSNTGTIINYIGGTVTNNIHFFNSGTYTNMGSYKGSGFFSGSLFNNDLSGIVSPGNSPGCLSFGNGFATSGTLNIEVNGTTTACTNYDKITVTGTATLDGILNVTIGYTPTNGDQITFIDATTLSGTFATVNAPSNWSVLYNSPSTGMVTLLYSAPLPGAALNFNGTTDYVSIDNLTATTNSNYTIEGWFKTSLTNSVQDIVSGFTSSLQSVFVVEVQLNGTLRFLHRVPAGQTGGNSVYTSSIVNNGAWHHFAAVHGPDELKIYLDGSLQGQSFFPEPISPEILNIRLGRLQDDTRIFQGSMDELRFWSRALCAAEIVNNMNCEIATTGNALVANYHFNQGIASGNNSSPAINTLTDATGNGFTGTLNNFTLTGSTSNWVTPGGVASGTSCVSYTTAEINVQGNSVSILDGDNTPSATDHTNFGSIVVGNNLVRTFTIQNTGSATLNVSGISSSNPLFVISGAPNTITGGSSATFNVTFNPTEAGTVGSTITINNNDCDEAVYNFDVHATGLHAQTSLSLNGASTSILGSATTFTSTLNRISTPTGAVAGEIVMFSITNPMGSTQTTSVVTNSSGVASYTYTSTMAGVHSVQVSFAGTPSLNPSNASPIAHTVTNPCTNPTLPGLSASNNYFCAGGSTTISVISGSLNDATTWQWYTGSCGGISAGSGNSLTVSPTTSTTYYVRGEGGCVTPGLCDSIRITVNPLPKIHLGAPDDSLFCPGVTLPLRAFFDTVQMQMNNSGQAGGAPISCHCPPGYVAVGFNGRTGSWLDKIQLACRKLNTNGTLDTAVVYTSTMGGNGGSPNGPYLLSGDTVLVGADLFKNNNYLTWVKGYGQPISHVIANGNNGSSPVAMATMGNGTPSSFFVQQFASAGQVIVGLKGWVNGFVPGLSLITMPINKVAGNTYLWSNSSTDSIINVSTPGTYSVAVTDAGGCVGTASIQMIERVIAAFSSCPANFVEYITSGCDKQVSYSPGAIGTGPLTQSYVLTGATVGSGTGTGSGLTFNKGITNVKLYVSNICGSDSCQFTVTVLDTIKPTISCQSNISVNNETGLCGATVVYAVPTFSDNCNSYTNIIKRINPNLTSSNTLSFLNPSIPAGAGSIKFSAFGDLDLTSEKWTFLDEGGNTLAVLGGSGGQCSTVYTSTISVPLATLNTWLANGSIDFTVNGSVDVNTGLCGGDFVEIQITYPNLVSTQLITGLSSGSFFPVGTTINQYVATDPSGNTDTCSFSVTVVDTTKPTITCPPAITVAVGASCEATLFGVNPSYVLNRTECFNPGQAAATLVAPTPGNSTGYAQSFNEYTLVTNVLAGESYIANASGNNFLTVTQGAPNGPVVAIGWGTLYAGGGARWTAAVSGNYYVHMKRYDIPCLSSFGQAIFMTALASGQVNLGSAIISENCGAVTVTNDAPTNFPIGNTTVTWTATDASGNASTCTQLVTVIDTTKPGISCPGDITHDNDLGICGAMINYTTPVGTDNCTGVTTIQTEGLASGSLFPIGTTTNKFIVTDASGNKDSCSFNVIIADNELPVLTNPGNQTFNVIANSCDTTYTITDPISDNCTGSVWRYILAGATVATGVYIADGVNAPNMTFNKGTTNVTLEGNDAAGLNAIPVNFTVTVTDNQSPDIICAAPVTLNAANGLCTATTTLTAPAVSDNCATNGNALNFDGSSDRVPVNTATTLTGPFTIEVWVKPSLKSTFSTILGNKVGGFGNSGFAFTINNFQQSDAKLIFESKNKSVASSSSVINWGAWQHVSVTYDGSIVRMYVNGTQIPSTDSSEINLVASGNPLVIGDFYQFVLGGKFLGTMDELRIWNVARTQAEIVGNMNNELNAQPGLLAAYHFNQGIAGNNNAGITTLLDASGNANTGTLSTFTLNGPTSNWVGGLINGLPTLTNNAPSSFPVGNTNVIWTATDASNNTSTCTQVVTVLDQQVPVISCPGNVVVSNDAGQCSAIVNYTTPIGTDNCTGAVTIQTEGLASGSAFPVGVTNNKFIVTDASGNKDSCSFTVTVNDTELPTISCPSPVSVGNDNNMCSAVVNYSTPVGADNCAGATTVQTEGLASGSTFPIGVTTNKFIVTDANGNKDSCSFTVTVTDNQLPVINCAANILTTSGYTPIAFYPLNTNLADMSGNFGNMILNGNPTAPASPGIGNPLCLNGIYLANTNGQNAITPNIASLDATNFKLNVDFKLNAYPVNSNGFPVIMGGDAYRWIGVYVNASGKAGVKYNNSIKVFSNTTLNLNQWYTATITYVNNTITLLIDNTVVLVQNVGPLVTGNNYKFLTSDFSVGTALNGCVRNLQILNGSSSCSSMVYYTAPVGTDNCAGATTVQTEGLASGSVFPLGVTTNKFVVTDANGNKDSCSFTVTVIDTLAPSLSCPSNITIQNDAGQCYGTIVLPSTLVLQYNPTGAQATNVPVNASFAADGYSGNPLSQVGLQGWTNNNRWPVGTITSSPTISLGEYLTFTMNVPSGTDLARIQYTKRSYFGTAATSASVRSSLDGYASDISTISVNPGGIQELVFDVSSMPFVSGAVTFRIYFWGAPVNLSDWVDLLSTASGGNGIRVYANTLSTASDNCNYSLSYTNFSPNYQYPIGTTVVQATATDASNNTSVCSFSVNVISPEIDVKGNNSSIVDGDAIADLADHTDFGDVTVGQTSTRTFTIKNNGTANLTLASGAISISGTDAILFSLSGITLPASIAPNDSLNFNVTFNASSNGIKNATINIANNDCDEAAYDFDIKGNGDCLPVTITCPGNQTVTTDQGACNALVNYNSSSTGIPSPALTYKFTGATTATGNGHGSGSIFNIGVTHVTLYASNNCSLDSCTFDVTVESGTTGSSSHTTCDSYQWTNGITYTNSGNYTWTFTNANGCDSVHTLNLTIHYSNHISSTVSNFGCYTWPVNNQTYTVNGTYVASFLNQYGCDSIHTLNLTITPGVKLAAKAILDGPYNVNTGLMNDSLRVNHLIPNSEPYTASPYLKPAIGGPSGESVSNAVLNVSGNDAIVDWVYLELRDAINPANVIASKRALIQRDGDIVSHTDGTSAVLFEATYNGNYFVTVKHRNHLGIMSANALSLQGCSTTSIDFTNPNPVYTMSSISTTPRKQAGSVYTMWSADLNSNKNVKYNGLSNDKDKILIAVGVGTPNNSVNNVYRMEDANLDGKIRYNNTDNDRMIIISNVGVNNPNNILNQHTPN